MEFLLCLQKTDRGQVPLVGGKAANLGELAKVDGITVPEGLCVTTHAFSAVIEQVPELTAAMQRLDEPGADIKRRSAEIRSLIEDVTLPPSLVYAISSFLHENSDVAAWAVRSSATAEDMSDASFAGQHESYLDRRGIESVLEAIKSCWASLYSERAVIYRQRNGIAHRYVAMAVIVQRTVPAEASGVMFTADPVTGDRTVVAIEAGTGTGEALVSGAVVPQGVKLRGGEIFARTGHGSAILSDGQARALAAIGRRIEKHFGSPQDIEWCLLDGAFSIVQSRPITTLFPIPPRQDGERHVYLSVGHQQMMIDAMKPLGLSVWQMLAARPMHEAGGQLFVDITGQLASPASRAALLNMLNRDPLIRSAVEDLLARSFLTSQAAQQESTSPAVGEPVRATEANPPPDAPDPAIVRELISRSEVAVEEAGRKLDSRSGKALFDFIADDLAALKQQLMDPQSMQAVMAGINATWWLNDRLGEWIGDKGVVDTLSQSVDNNVTSRMGLDLLDVADAIRPNPAAISFLRGFDEGASLANLGQVEGGAEALAAIDGYLARYGMRCAGEIDITRTRWREEPGLLVPMILANIDRFPPGEAARRFDAGLRRAKAAEEDVLQRLAALPNGAEKAAQAKSAIDVMRAFIGYREYPKYGWVSRIDLHRQAMLREARRMVESGVLDRVDDIFYLRFDELRETVGAERADRALIVVRRAEFAAHERLVPPRVLTSDGEALFGDFRRDNLDANMIPGLGVSAGSVEGRARIILHATASDIDEGDILVTTFTDPSWTPLFLTVAGLVTEAGGQMSHGAVVAREYGIPAIVAVKDATRRIRDGQRIRIDGATGVITILS
ncbi:MAG: phosphoenolpyruvate synthase [Xanthobacteraceae bacterium]